MYGSEVWEGTKGGAKRILGCSSVMRLLEVTWGWIYYRVVAELRSQEWNVKPRRGRQRKCWCKVVDNSLGLE